MHGHEQIPDWIASLDVVILLVFLAVIAFGWLTGALPRSR